MEEKTILVRFALRSDFEEGQENGRGLRLGQGGMLEGMRP